MDLRHDRAVGARRRTTGLVHGVGQQQRRIRHQRSRRARPPAKLTDFALVPPVGALLGSSGFSIGGADILRHLPHYDIPDAAALEGEPLRADRKIGARFRPAW